MFVVVTAPIEMYEKAQAESWPSRKGLIKTSYANQGFGFSIGRNGRPYWKAKICGTYKDNGEKFCISRVRLGLHVGDQTRSGVLETAARYPVGSEVDVFYNPENPKDTTLESHSSWHEMFTILGIGIVFSMLPVFLWVFRKRIDPERYGRT